MNSNDSVPRGEFAAVKETLDERHKTIVMQLSGLQAQLNANKESQDKDIKAVSQAVADVRGAVENRINAMVGEVNRRLTEIATDSEKQLTAMGNERKLEAKETNWRLAVQTAVLLLLVAVQLPGLIALLKGAKIP